MKIYAIALLVAIQALVGEKTLDEIRSREGGEKFVHTFFADEEWMAEFASSGPMNTSPFVKPSEETKGAYFVDAKKRMAAALKALAHLSAHDKTGFIAKTKTGRNAATALALNHGIDFDDKKLADIMDLYAAWYEDGTLADIAKTYDTRQWREVMTFGQNAPLGVDSLVWIHDFANLPPNMYRGLFWLCTYRPFNCFGASVQGPDYYTPWEKELSIQELRYRVGGVCGALSKFASHCAASHGIRTVTAGQPGHCAFTIWDEENDRWTIDYNVTAHTNPHFILGGKGFSAVEEQDIYFRNPKRYSAERLRMEGRYEESMKECPGNWQAAYEWWLELKDRNAAKEEWLKFGAAVRGCFANAPCEGWQLYMRYLRSAKFSSEENLVEVKKGLYAFKEREAETVERAYFDEIALDPILDLFHDDESMWQLLPDILSSQSKTPSFYAQTVNWGSKIYMRGPENSKRFLAAVEKSAKESGASLDFSAMALEASKSADIAMFKQVFGLMERISLQKVPEKTGHSWPTEAYGGVLLSADGMLKTSSTSQWDDPTFYKSVLEAEEVKGSGQCFHTDKEEHPWGCVMLPGSSDITGITIVNSGTCVWRQNPIEIWLSEDGENFAKVYQSEEKLNEWKCAFDTPKKAKYVMVCRREKAKNDYFHLKKILVYGKKLY